MDRSDPPLTVVGIGADGWAGLPGPSRAAVAEAEVVLGGPRHLAMLPADLAVAREPWPSPLRAGLPDLLARHAGRRVTALASGDPMLSGVGSTLVGLLGADRVRVLPAVSSVALARARMGWPAESVTTVSTVGRDLDTVRRELAPGARLVVLSADGRTPAALAALLVEAGYGASRLTVLCDLGGAREDRLTGTAAAWGHPETPRLNVVCVEAPTAPDAPALATVPGLPDDAYEHDGQLTKRDLRAAALARLAPLPGQLLWDVGAGAGSVGIEWMRAHPRCRAIAVEADAARAERIGRNARRLGVPALQVRHARAPEGLAGLPAPDAVFVGGGASRPGTLEHCWAALAPGGRLVAHAVTLETEQVLLGHRSRLGGELVRLAVEHAEPLGGFTGWAPARAVVQWAVTKPATGGEA